MYDWFSVLKSRSNGLTDERNFTRVLASLFTFLSPLQEELYAELPPLPSSSFVEDEFDAGPDYTSIRSLVSEGGASLDTVLIYDSVLEIQGGLKQLKTDLASHSPNNINNSGLSVEVAKSSIYDVVDMIPAVQADSTTAPPSALVKEDLISSPPPMARPESQFLDGWQHWELDRQQINLINLFGQGEFGEVWAGKLIGTGKRKGYAAAVGSCFT